MQITIGKYQLDHLSKNNLDKNIIIQTVNDILNVMHENHPHYSILNDIRDRYVLLNKSTFIVTGNGTLRHYNNFKLNAKTALKDLIKTPGLEDSSYLLGVISENISIADEKIEQRLKRRVIKLFYSPA